jgi:hypothetical protein
MLEALYFSKLKWHGRIRRKERKRKEEECTLLSGGPEGRYITVVI